MEDGDLGTWTQPRIMLVLDDTLAHVTGRMERSSRTIRKVWVPNDPDEWEWGLITVKTIQRYAYNSVPVDVITFISTEVADLAAVWFQKYDVEVAGTEYHDLAHFQRSLTWRRNGIQRVIDTDPERLLHYGQLGHQILFNGEF
jgi:hypothetical protein